MTNKLGTNFSQDFSPVLIKLWKYVEYDDTSESEYIFMCMKFILETKYQNSKKKKKISGFLLTQNIKDVFSVLPIYRGRMVDPIFWRPKARYFSQNHVNSLDTIRGRHFFC